MRINVHAGHNPAGKVACGAVGLPESWCKGKFQSVCAEKYQGACNAG